MEDSPVLKDYRIVLFIDEFTTAYEWLRAGAIDSSFVQHWKGLVGMKLFSAVLAGQDTMPAFVEATGNRNAFRVFEWRHLHYLPKEDAMRLVTEPIIEATGNPDVFLGDAVQRVLEYSASNAYYTKWICYELVRHMNLYQLKRISELDVEEAVRDGINNSTLKDCEDLFDALTTAGLQDGFPGLFSKEEAEAVLDVIANAQWKSPRLGCYKNYISIPGVDVAGLLNDLCRREVLVHQQNYYSIRVKLYLLWVRKKLFGSV